MQIIFRHSAPLRLSLKRRDACIVLLVVTLVLLVGSCGDSVPLANILPNDATDPVDESRFQLVTRFVHISDAQIVDEQSPGRMTSLTSVVGGTQAAPWRVQEAYSAQLLDGVVRTINKLHVAERPIDFVVHTGDATDNAQHNELAWFMTVMDGGHIDPLSGPDDRTPSQTPEARLDPHQPFAAQGLYQQGQHGSAPTIKWYDVFGNHDRFAGGTFPILTDQLGRRVAPMPLQSRIGLFLPVDLDPIGVVAWGPISPALPGPPSLINFPKLIQPNPQRHFITDREFIQAHLDSKTEPRGHGFDPDHPTRTWYSVSPTPGVRLIGINSCTPLLEQPKFVFSEGAISVGQALALRKELAAAQARDEIVIVASHHPSATLEVTYGTSLTPNLFRELLGEYPCVKLHLAGHIHANLVVERDGYLEVITNSSLDSEQAGRIVEIWQSDDAVEIRYRLFTHLVDIPSPDAKDEELFKDPLLPLRRKAFDLAKQGV